MAGSALNRAHEQAWRRLGEVWLAAQQQEQTFRQQATRSAQHTLAEQAAQHTQLVRQGAMRIGWGRMPLAMLKWQGAKLKPKC